MYPAAHDVQHEQFPSEHGYLKASSQLSRSRAWSHVQVHKEKRHLSKDGVLAPNQSRHCSRANALLAQTSRLPANRLYAWLAASNWPTCLALSN